MGERHAPCGTPLSNGKAGHMYDYICICAFLSVMKYVNVRDRQVDRFKMNILCLRPVSQTLSKALDTSRNTIFMVCLFVRSFDIVSCSVAKAVVNFG